MIELRYLTLGTFDQKPTTYPNMNKQYSHKNYIPITTMLNLLNSAPIIPIPNEHVLAVVLSVNDAYAAVSQDDASVYVFSLINGSHKLRIKDPCGCIVIIGIEVVVGSAEGF